MVKLKIDRETICEDFGSRTPNYLMKGDFISYKGKTYEVQGKMFHYTDDKFLEMCEIFVTEYTDYDFCK